MAISILSNKPLGRVWCGVVNLDTGAGTSTLASVSTVVNVLSIAGSLTAGDTSPVVDWSVESGDGDLICRHASGAGASPGGQPSLPVPVKVSGLVVRCNDVAGGASPSAAISIMYQHVGGAAPTEK